MLSRFDDYPIHQTPEPLLHTVSSDRNTYDRFWYNGHDKEGHYYFGIALCRYPNLGITDCSLSLAVDGNQYAFHGSRRSSDEPTDLTVGPFKLHIVEPMGQHRLVIDDNDTGISCDLLFTPRTVPFQEGRQTTRNTRHVVMDATRLDQFGSWQGEIRYDDKILTVDARNNCGLKDRSWGIRPVGEPYTGGAPLDPRRIMHFMWLPLHWENQCTLAGCFEYEDGYQWHSDQVILPAYASPDSIPGITDPNARHWQGIVNHSIQFESGTRRAKSGILTMNNRHGESMEISVEPLLRHHMKGLGYQNPAWGHGHWQGELKIGAEFWTQDELDPLAFENLHVQQVVKARCGNDIGYGVLEQFHLGPYEPYGFTGYVDGYRS